ncbi:hypothetical protein [Corynebacterium uterequi]|uniref:Secreted protein n=1 Tax=Corynebacterium uterequi TaxID=1072256 RepID=A0A0G3HHY1_9CORY|nr:hypothetical protein [Corynebacterium uterequi]AKK10737.1 hypothetical protein CUTER_03645 [Corynebacterium uterequi]
MTTFARRMAAAGIAVATLTLGGAMVPQASADTASVGATPDGWTPAPKLRQVQQGPQPGTTCSRPGERREYVELVGSYYAVEGAQSTSNTSDVVIPLQQTLKESRSRKWTWSAAVTVSLTKEIKEKYSWDYSREMVWSMGQRVGPYDLNPGEKGTLTWGFIMDQYTSQPVRCANGSWQAFGRVNSGSAPRERHVEVTIEDMA